VLGSHSRKGREGVGIPGGCSSPAKRPAKALAPGAGRGRRRHTSRRRERRGPRETDRQKRSRNAADGGLFGAGQRTGLLLGS